MLAANFVLLCAVSQAWGQQALPFTVPSHSLQGGQPLQGHSWYDAYNQCLKEKVVIPLPGPKFPTFPTFRGFLFAESSNQLALNAIKSSIRRYDANVRGEFIPVLVHSKKQ